MKKGHTINFKVVNNQVLKIADLILSNRDYLIRILTRYETYKTAQDEIDRSLDLLTNLHENKQYFKTVVGPIATFMPSNQPLYSFMCFAVIPALMSEKVSIKAPEITNSFYEDMLNFFKIHDQIFTIEYMRMPRNKCIEIFTATTLDINTNQAKPVYDAVIFTGTSKNADILRKKFHKSVLFISNGSGHNPLIVSDTADINKAVKSIMSVRTYNQGQDCASPNSILVHSKVFEDVLNKLRIEVRNLIVGRYDSPSTDIGPISRPDTIPMVRDFLSKNHQYIDDSSEAIIRIRTNIVEPTIVIKPLLDGPNFEEVFAPIFLIQKYEKDSDLKLYFEDSRYSNNAMYITIFGKSDYINNFVKNDKIGSKLHDHSTLIYNSDLHEPGIERGIFPYGGYGRGASSVSKDGILLSKPTLPTREIFEYLVQKIPIRNEVFHSKQEKKLKFSTNLLIDKNEDLVQQLLHLYPRDIVKWLYLKNTKMQLLKLAEGENIFRTYDDFDLLISSTSNSAEKYFDASLLNLFEIVTPDCKNAISFREIVGYGQSLNWNEAKLMELLNTKGKDYSCMSITSRLPRARYWLENFNNQKIISLRVDRNIDYMKSIPKKRLEQIKKFNNYISENLDKNSSINDIKLKLYNIGKDQSKKKEEIIIEQRRFFKDIYMLLIGLETGPRLSTFIWSADKEIITKLLNTEDFI